MQIDGQKNGDELQGQQKGDAAVESSSSPRVSGAVQDDDDQASALDNKDNAKITFKENPATISYTGKIVTLFGLVAVMTALIAALVLALVWEDHFSSYAKENMQRLARYTAVLVSYSYDRFGTWDEAIEDLSDITLDETTSILVLDNDGQIIYSANLTDSQTSGDDSTIYIPPGSVSQSILVDGVEIGTVEVWDVDSGTFISGRDDEFKATSYGAIVFAAIVAVLISSVIGYLLARGLINPIKRITRTVNSIRSGNLSARTKLEGVDEISQLGMMFDDMANSIENDRKLERRLVNDVAHELRTPLMAMQATVEAMADGVLPADQQNLAMVNNEVVRLGKLVDALLKLSRLENRAVQIKAEELDLGQLIEELVMNHQMLLEESNLDLHYIYEPRVMVMADPDLIKQATSNILSNAVRYTPAGGRIDISVSSNQMMAQIAVKDTGMGMSPEDLSHVFSRFWRADSARDRVSGGLGIGLAIVKEIVDRHNGWVNVESTLGKGSTFTINIPLIKEDPKKKKRSDITSSWIIKTFTSGAKKTGGAKKDSADKKEKRNTRQNKKSGGKNGRNRRQA